jgi:hypothetical protein
VPIDFAQISSTEDQRPAGTSPVAITMNQNDEIQGIEHSTKYNSTEHIYNSDIRISDSGIYVIIAAPQVGRTSGTEGRYIDFWLRKNGADVKNSAVRCVLENHKEKDVLINQSMMRLSSGDILNIMMCVEAAGEGLGIEAISVPGRPAIPSIIVSMLKIKDSNEGHWVSKNKGTTREWID